jgi:hypothetical protein
LDEIIRREGLGSCGTAVMGQREREGRVRGHLVEATHIMGGYIRKKARSPLKFIIT